MSHFSSHHVVLGGIQLQGVAPATANPHHSTELAGRFRRLLLSFPVHFLDIVEIPQTARIDLQWVTLCPSAGLVMLRDANPEPDVFALMLNGLESEPELAVVRQHTPMLRDRWDQIDALVRPTAVYAYMQVSRVFDPGIATILYAFATTYFDLFGTASG